MMPLSTLGIDASRTSVAEKTGTEWYSSEIISALARLEERPRLRLYRRPGVSFAALTGVEEITIDRKRLWTHIGLSSELRRSPVDALFVPAHVLPRSHPKATVVTIHDIGYRFEPGAHTLQRRTMLELTTRWNARRAARIIAPSLATSRDLHREYGVDAARIDVIHHGLDHRRFRPIPESEVESVLSKLGIPRPYLLFVSTIQPRKNLQRIVSAFESREFAGFKLVVAGGAGWKSGAIIERMRLSSRRNDILQLGYVSNDDLAALYNGAAAFVFPSLYEGFGMGVIEAMACGCPVVTSTASSLPEIAGDAAILVDPYAVPDIRDGILEALEPSNRDLLRTRGFRRAQSFTWQRAAQQTMSSIQMAYREEAG
jgi:glycosyltransferase involved in cell wall biosynthesis